MLIDLLKDLLLLCLFPNVCCGLFLIIFGNTYHQALFTKPMELNVNFHL